MWLLLASLGYAIAGLQLCGGVDGAGCGCYQSADLRLVVMAGD